MKNIYTLALILIPLIGFGQSVGIGTASPDPSAALDITSSNGGILIPRVDTSMISSPATGLMVFNPTDNGFYFYNGSLWQQLGTVSELKDQDGDTYIRVEQNPDEDVIRLSAGGTESLIIRDGKLDMGASVDNVVIGHNAGLSQTGSQSIIIGEDAGKLNEGSQNIMIGNYAGLNNTTGGANTMVGDQSGLNNTLGFSNTFIGKDAGFRNEEGNTNIAVGFTAGRQNILGNNKIFVGNSAGYNHDTIIGSALMIGHSAGLTNNQPGNTFVGNYSSQYGHMKESITIGEYSGRYSDGVRNIAIGKEAGYRMEGDNNVAVGFLSGFNSIGSRNIFVGRQAGQENDHSDNVFVGDLAGRWNSDGYKSVMVGAQAGQYDTLSIQNVYIGYQAGQGGSNLNFRHQKRNNVMIGERAGFSVQGDNNTILGYRAGELSTGEGNIFIGKQAGRNEANDNRLYVDNSDTSTPLIYGNLDQDSLVINGKLSVNSEYTFPEIDGSSNQVLQTDGSGNVSWANHDDGDWSPTFGGLYNSTDRIGIGTLSLLTSRKLTVESNTESTTGYFRQNASTGTSYSLAGFNYGNSSTNKYGVYGWATNEGTGNRIGVFGGAWGNSTSNGYGGYLRGYGENSTGVYAFGETLAANLDGDVDVGKAGEDNRLEMDRGSIEIVNLGSTNDDNGVKWGEDENVAFGLVYDGEGSTSLNRLHLREYIGATSDLMTIRADGKIGIKNDSPIYDLHLSNNSAAKPSSSSWIVTSDERSKEVTNAFDDGLETILKINPVHFTYNGNYGISAGTEGIGTVAQELQKIAPYMVKTAEYSDEEANTSEEYLTVDYGAMDFVLINAIKELKALIEQQNEKIRELESKLNKD